MQLDLVVQLRGVAAHDREERERLRTQERLQPSAVHAGVPPQPGRRHRLVLEQHRIALGDRVVPQPAVLERHVALRVREVQRVPELVPEGAIVRVAAVRADDQVHLVRHADRRAKRPGLLAGSLLRVETNPAIL